MEDWEIQLSEVSEMLKLRLELLKESGLSYLPKVQNLEQSAAIIENQSELSAMARALDNCQKCKLCEGRNKVVFGTGSEDAKIVFVGEGPGAEEDKQGEPFVGRAGKLLTKMIEAMGLSRDQVYICNVVKCRPPENRDPLPEEIAACEPFLQKQLSIIKPKIIIGLGRHACQTLLKTKITMSKIRGQWHEYEGIKFMPTFHPAYLLRNPPAKKFVWADLQEVLAKLK